MLTPLVLAATEGRFGVARALVQGGADVNSRGWVSSLFLVDSLQKKDLSSIVIHDKLPKREGQDLFFIASDFVQLYSMPFKNYLYCSSNFLFAVTSRIQIDYM